MIRAARAYGLVSVAVEGEVPPIGDFTPGDCPLSWRLEFEPDGPRERARGTSSRPTPMRPRTVSVCAARRPPRRAGRARAQDRAAAAPALRARVPRCRRRDGSGAVRRPRRKAGGAAAGAARQPPPTRLRVRCARSLRVDLDRVDRLVNLVGEVLIAQAALTQGVGETADGGPVRDSSRWSRR